MNRLEKRTFASKLIDDVKTNIIQAINQSKVPEEWEEGDIIHHIANEFKKLADQNTELTTKKIVDSVIKKHGARFTLN